MTNGPTLFLVDGSSQMYRAYHAIRGLTGPDGRPTNAVYGFVTMLRKLIADERPDGVIAAFDLAGPTFRSDLSADYKANRAPMPPDLAEQIPAVHRACEALGVPVITAEGFEADDVIGTLATRAAAAGRSVVIVTGDKDLLQLVADRVRVLNPKDDGVWYDAAAVRERFGVPPDRVVDVLALMGDAVDNVKGVPGIGEKGAIDLVAAFGTLDELLARRAEVPQKRYREALAAHGDEARQSRELVRIRTDVPLAVDLDRLGYHGPDRKACFDLFSALGFRTLLAEFAPGVESVERDYRLAATIGEIETLADEIRAAGRVALHVLAGPPSDRRAAVVGLAFATVAHRARYVPVGHGALAAEPQIPLAHALECLGPILTDVRIRKIGHDLKAVVVHLARHGVRPAGLAADTMLASYLLEATRDDHPLEALALEQLGYKAISEEDLLGRGVKALAFGDLPPSGVLEFAAERADLALQLADRLAPGIDSAGLAPLLSDMELPLIPVLADVELAGVKIDSAALAALGARLDRDLASLTARVHELAGGTFNINSPKQLSEVLFDRLKLPSLRKTGKTRTSSTSVEVLEELALVHDLPRLVLEWRSLSKLKGTYVDALPALVDPVDGRLHTTFNQAVAATGRLSSSDPNLQNIPIRTELGREIRAAFVAEPGSVLISADYSQIELRVLAHLSLDDALIDAFRRGEDIHDRTARAVFGTSSGLDRYELRRRAKIVNYALIYGKTAFTLARDIGVTQQAAQEFIDAYFRGFPGVRAFIERTLEEARTSGVVTTLFGRRRAMPDLVSSNAQARAAAERAAVNMPVQGTAADILKRAMIALDAELRARGTRWPGARMILTVHDELLIETPAEHAEPVAALVREQMEQAADLVVPLTVDIGVGRNWRDAKP